MAKHAKCDSCKVEGKLGNMGEAPSGWVEAIERRPSMEYNKDYLACSPLCMGKLMADRAAEQHQQRPLSQEDTKTIEDYLAQKHVPQDEEPARRG